ncbi:MAG: nitroreductase family protein [Mycobacteriales bacterium]
MGAAVQNRWLAAHAHGVGVAFMGDVLIAEDEIRGCLGMTGDAVGVMVLANLHHEPEPRRPHSGLRDVVWHSPASVESGSA